MTNERSWHVGREFELISTWYAVSYPDTVLLLPVSRTLLNSKLVTVLAGSCRWHDCSLQFEKEFCRCIEHSIPLPLMYQAFSLRVPKYARKAACGISCYSKAGQDMLGSPFVEDLHQEVLQSYILYVQYRQTRRETPIFRRPFFRKQCFSLKYSLVSPPQNFWRYV